MVGAADRADSDLGVKVDRVALPPLAADSDDDRSGLFTTAGVPAHEGAPRRQVGDALEQWRKKCQDSAVASSLLSSPAACRGPKTGDVPC